MTRYVLPFAAFCELVALVSGVASLSLVAGGAFLVYFLFRLPRLGGYARYLMLTAVTVIAGLLAGGRLSGPELGEAATAAAFYGTFLGSLGTMQCLVRRFELLRRAHDVLLAGRPIWLYPKYVLTSCTIASVLSFGVMSLLCGSLPETLRQRDISGQARTRWLRSILTSTLRGFALVPLIAPTSVAVAIITREVPSLGWAQMLPFTLVAALVFVAVGWVTEHRRFTAVSAQRTELGDWPAGTAQLLAVVGAVFGGITLLATLTPLNVSRAAMLCVPGITFLYMSLQDGSLAGASTQMINSVTGLSNEICIFAASAALGVTLSAQVPPELLSQLLEGQASLLMLMAGGLLILPLFACAGIAPITVLSFLAGVLGELAVSGADPLLLAVALAIGFSLAMMLSPFGPSVMLLSRFAGMSRWVVAFGWNGRFALVSIPLMLVLMWVFQYWTMA
jgi:hypothetical protein